ncbi:alpha/beta hydrolase family protein [Micromonosporaceae bacterium Da 78-11]
MRRCTVGLFLGLILLAGCTDDGPPEAAPSPAAPVAGADCPLMADGGRQVRFGLDGATNLAGILAGTGPTGVVLAHESEGDLCIWAAELQELVAQGYRVLAFDSQGYGASQSAAGTGFDDDVVAAAATLRADGATRIVLRGASMGGTFSLSAAARISPPVTAVISSSGPTVFAGVSAEEVVPRLTMPLLFVAQEDDGLFGEAAKQMYAEATASAGRRVKITTGSTHGFRLVAPGGDSQIRAVVADFLTTNAPPA